MSSSVVLAKGATGRVAVESAKRFAVADTRTLTLYENGRPVAKAVSDEPLPGPLRSLPSATGARFGWGPSPVSRADRPLAVGPLMRAALSDVTDHGDRDYRLVIGAVDTTATFSAVYLRWQAPRTVGGRSEPPSPQPITRLAVVDLARLSRTATLPYGEPGDPSSLAIVGQSVAVGLVRKVLVFAGAEAPPVQLPTGTSKTVTCLVPTGNAERVAAGTADGRVFVWVAAKTWPGTTWAAHDSAVTAVTWGSADQTVWTGARDGTVRQWRPDGQRVTDLSFGAEVVGVGQLDDRRIVVCVGGRRAGIHLVTLR